MPKPLHSSVESIPDTPKKTYFSRQPSKEEMEKDVSLPVAPERLARAVMAGGAPRQGPKGSPT